MSQFDIDPEATLTHYIFQTDYRLNDMSQFFLYLTIMRFFHFPKLFPKLFSLI